MEVPMVLILVYRLRVCRDFSTPFKSLVAGRACEVLSLLVYPHMIVELRFERKCLAAVWALMFLGSASSWPFAR